MAQPSANGLGVGDGIQGTVRTNGSPISAHAARTSRAAGRPIRRPEGRRGERTQGAGAPWRPGVRPAFVRCAPAGSQAPPADSPVRCGAPRSPRYRRLASRRCRRRPAPPMSPRRRVQSSAGATRERPVPTLPVLWDGAAGACASSTVIIDREMSARTERPQLSVASSVEATASPGIGDAVADRSSARRRRSVLDERRGAGQSQ
jgi:hypothetical protein